MYKLSGNVHIQVLQMVSPGKNTKVPNSPSKSAIRDRKKKREHAS